MQKEVDKKMRDSSGNALKNFADGLLADKYSIGSSVVTQVAAEALIKKGIVKSLSKPAAADAADAADAAGTDVAVDATTDAAADAAAAASADAAAGVGVDAGVDAAAEVAAEAVLAADVGTIGAEVAGEADAALAMCAATGAETAGVGCLASIVAFAAVLFLTAPGVVLDIIDPEGYNEYTSNNINLNTRNKIEIAVYNSYQKNQLTYPALFDLQYHFPTQAHVAMTATIGVFLKPIIQALPASEAASPLSTKVASSIAKQAVRAMHERPEERDRHFLSYFLTALPTVLGLVWRALPRKPSLGTAIQNDTLGKLLSRKLQARGTQAQENEATPVVSFTEAEWESVALTLPHTSVYVFSDDNYFIPAALYATEHFELCPNQSSANVYGLSLSKAGAALWNSDHRQEWFTHYDELTALKTKPTYRPSMVALYSNEYRVPNTNDPGVDVTGLLWAPISAIPDYGRKLTNGSLMASLGPTNLAFTQTQWDSFKITDLKPTDYVQAGGAYYQPSRPIENTITKYLKEPMCMQSPLGILVAFCEKPRPKFSPTAYGTSFSQIDGMCHYTREFCERMGLQFTDDNGVSGNCRESPGDQLGEGFMSLFGGKTAYRGIKRFVATAGKILGAGGCRQTNDNTPMHPILPPGACCDWVLDCENRNSCQYCPSGNHPSLVGGQPAGYDLLQSYHGKYCSTTFSCKGEKGLVEGMPCVKNWQCVSGNCGNDEESDGLQWRLLGSAKPDAGTLLTNAKLSEALGATRPQVMTFTKRQWESFGVNTVTTDNYVLARGVYYTPVTPSTRRCYGKDGEAPPPIEPVDAITLINHDGSTVTIPNDAATSGNASSQARRGCWSLDDIISYLSTGSQKEAARNLKSGKRCNVYGISLPPTVSATAFTSSGGWDDICGQKRLEDIPAGALYHIFDTAPCGFQFWKCMDGSTCTAVPRGEWTSCDARYWGWKATHACHDFFGKRYVSATGKALTCGEKKARYECSVLPAVPTQPVTSIVLTATSGHSVTLDKTIALTQKGHAQSSAGCWSVDDIIAYTRSHDPMSGQLKSGAYTAIHSISLPDDVAVATYNSHGAWHGICKQIFIERIAAGTLDHAFDDPIPCGFLFYECAKGKTCPPHADCEIAWGEWSSCKMGDGVDAYCHQEGSQTRHGRISKPAIGDGKCEPSTQTRKCTGPEVCPSGIACPSKDTLRLCGHDGKSCFDMTMDADVHVDECHNLNDKMTTNGQDERHLWDDLKSGNNCDFVGIAHLPEGKSVWVNGLSGRWPHSANSCINQDAHVIDKPNCSICGCEKDEGFGNKGSPGDWNRYCAFKVLNN